MMPTDEVPKASLVVNADANAITDIAQRFQRFRSYQYFPRDPVASGRLTRMVGLTLEARGVNAAVGHSCLVISRDGLEIETEVVGFHNDTTYLMPIQGVVGLQPGARVRPMDRRSNMVMGEHLCGRVLDGIGKPLDALGPLQSLSRDEFKIKQINPLHRHPIEEPLDVGIRAINALLTVGKGQRIGLFAGSGVGKSVLLGMMTRYTSADVVVVGLIGERGREVKEFIDLTLGADGLTKSVVVASPADDAPLMRLRAAQLATRIAEYFRDQGKDVLLLMDSLTRYGQAQREIALSIGEPPATKGYPPSVFSKIPALVERAGNGEKGGGSITAIYTVLTEGDDLHDPIADAARAILDGHIVLSRRLAEEGVYPAIDIEASVSRVMPNIVSDQHLQDAQKFKRLMGLYHGNKDLISIGAYVKGSDPGIDEAIERYPALTRFIGQKVSVGSVYEKSIKELSGILHQSENDTPQKHLSSPLQTQNAGGNTKDANEKGINVSNSLQKGY